MYCLNLLVADDRILLLILMLLFMLIYMFLLLLLLLLTINYLLITCINTLYSFRYQFIYLVLYLHHTDQQPVVQAHSTLVTNFIHTYIFICICIYIKPIHVTTLFDNLIALFYHQPPIPPTLIHSPIIFPTVYSNKIYYLPGNIQQLHGVGQYRQYT